MPEATTHSLEQEIEQLQKQLTEKKTALGEMQLAGPEQLPSDKEILRQVVGEKIQQHVSDYQPVPRSAAPAAPVPAAGSDSPSYLDPALQPQVQRLVAVAFSKGIEAAIKEAGQTQNAALIDAFHDVIVDRLFQELVKRKFVPEVQ